MQEYHATTASKAIYEHDFEWADHEVYAAPCKSFYMSIPGDFCLRLLIHLPSDYPSRSCPIAEVYESFGVSSSDCDAIIHNLGDVCLYEWIESVREQFGSFASFEASSLEVVDMDAAELLLSAAPSPCDDIPPFLRQIKTGVPITDRKSTFQAVVVSRWYGGILLGPDRFKHIANCARQVLETHGFIHRKTKKQA
ncbi:hypothetical protein DYB25_001578 [Aphanomyces astaci]|uniref:Uncharacterized protein n=1 Tax=Aphanomyces astaci TaxID=112090 RepID=A0A397E9T8_APHAT|nr:hypothetical protein DYB25_001578 [Aphanomyces astaci]RHY78207.1 hypothetical protein DYB38_002216 [Aphanomyces astaci]